jgi:nicotinamide-nucleotide amidase
LRLVFDRATIESSKCFREQLATMNQPRLLGDDNIRKVRAIQQLLVARRDRLVLAESCTAGLVAGLFGQIPGISEVLCGSFIVYRTASKTAWLGIASSLLENPKAGPVSSVVTFQLAISALEKTPEATVAAAITGHLGPNAPAGMDGLIYTCVVHRNDMASGSTKEHRLEAPAPSNADDVASRSCRQQEAAFLLMDEIAAFLQ